MVPNCFAGCNDIGLQPDLDFDVGYSNNKNDLDSVDTDYVLSEHAPSLDSNDLNVVHLNIGGAINNMTVLVDC